MRETPAILQRLYIDLAAEPSDINEHLPLLRELSAKCEHVTEFGARGGLSTVALLAGQPSTFVTWDIDPMAIASVISMLLAATGKAVVNAADLASVTGRTKFEPRVGDTLKIITEPTDLLFIDTLHTARQLRDELLRHADKGRVRKYLVFHDTTTFGMRGEDGTEPGLRMAIRWYQKEHMFPLWELIEDRSNNNGLVVLRHICAEGHSPSRVRGCCAWCGDHVP